MEGSQSNGGPKPATQKCAAWRRARDGARYAQRCTRNAYERSKRAATSLSRALREGWRGWSWDRRLELGFTAVVAISTCWYAVVASRQLSVLSDQARPWVVLDHMAFDEDKEHTIKAAIRNVGGGPAFDVGFALECTTASIGVQGYDLFADAEDALSRASHRILQWTSIGQSSVRAGYVIQSNLRLDRPDGVVPCCFGRITYSDAAGRSHESGFAMIYNPVPRKVQEQANTGGLGPGIGWLSNSFADASDFKAVGGERLNYAR
jgi:hypothetical protein